MILTRKRGDAVVLEGDVEEVLLVGEILHGRYAIHSELQLL